MTFQNLIHRQLFTLRLLTLVMLLTLVVGCGKGKSSSSKGAQVPDPIKACELVAQTEIESLIGASLDEPRQTHNESENPKHWMSMCNYYSNEKGISIGITVVPHGRKVNGAEAFALYEADLKEGLGKDYKMELVEGIGEHAGWEKGTKQLTIFQGPFMLIVSAGSPEIEGAAALGLSKQLAEKVLAKLP
jgi:hypothetical protein